MDHWSGSIDPQTDPPGWPVIGLLCRLFGLAPNSMPQVLGRLQHLGDHGRQLASHLGEFRKWM